MLKKGKSLILTLVCLAALLSCTSQTGAYIKGKASIVKNFKTIAVAEVFIAPPFYPILPLLDAGPYRDAALKVADQTIAAQKEVVNSYYSTLVDGIKASFSGTVLGGDELLNSAAYKEVASMGVELFDTKTAFKQFPDIILPDNAINFLDFSRETDVGLRTDSVIKAQAQNLAKLCGALGTDAVVVGMAYVDTVAVGMFGTSGLRMLKVELYFVDASGNVAPVVIANSAGMTCGSQETPVYKTILSTFPTVIDLSMKKLFTE
jgi:hypothetical protein